MKRRTCASLAALLLLLDVDVVCAQLSTHDSVAGSAEPRQGRQNGENAEAAASQAGPTTPEVNRVITFWLGRTESDNIGRTPAAVRGTYDSIGSTLDLSRDVERLNTSLFGDVQFIHYLEQEFEDETVGTLGGHATFSVVPQRFMLTVEDSFRQGRSDAFQAVGPGNREIVNVLSAGPQLALPLGGRDLLVMNARYSRRTYQDSSNLDSDLVSAEGGIFRQVRKTVRLGLVGDSRRVEYDPAASNYRMQSLSIRLDKRFRTGGMVVQGGRSELLMGRSRSTSPLIRLQWNRRLGTRSRLSVSGIEELSDPGELSQASTSRFLPERPTDVPLSASAMTQRQVNALYEITLPRGGLAVGYGTYRYLFETARELDDEGTNATLAFAREVTPLLGVRLSFSRLDREFVLSGIHNDETEIAVSASRRLGQHAGVGASLTTYDHGGPDAFSETRLEIRISYTPVH